MSSVSVSGPPSVVSMDDHLFESDVGSASDVASETDELSRVSTPSGADSAAKHPRFYYQDGSLTLLVSDIQGFIA